MPRNPVDQLDPAVASVMATLGEDYDMSRHTRFDAAHVDLDEDFFDRLALPGRRSLHAADVEDGAKPGATVEQANEDREPRKRVQPLEAGERGAAPPTGLVLGVREKEEPARRRKRERRRMTTSRPRFEAGWNQYSPLITKYEPRIVPASFDFWRANLNEPSSAGTSIPSESLNPTARFFGLSSVYATLIESPFS